MKTKTPKTFKAPKTPKVKAVKPAANAAAPKVKKPRTTKIKYRILRLSVLSVTLCIVSLMIHEGAMEVGVEFNSLSKTYNLTGLRLSFLIGNREIVSKFKTVRSQFDYGTSFIYQKAAVAALNGPQGYVADNRAEYELRRNALVAGIKKLGLKPADVKGTMFVWAAIPDGYTSSADYVMELLNKTGVLCTPGSSFGSLGEGHVRFALVLPHEEIENIFSNL